MFYSINYFVLVIFVFEIDKELDSKRYVCEAFSCDITEMEIKTNGLAIFGFFQPTLIFQYKPKYSKSTFISVP